MARSNKQLLVSNQRLALIWVVAIGVLVLLGGVWAWYQYLHRGAYNVFWGTVDTNLNLFGVTRTTTQENGEAKFQQRMQISLGANDVARGVTAITQPSANGTTVVVTETIGTPTNNYVRYTSIQSPTKVNTDSILNKWSRDLLVVGNNQNRSILTDNLLSALPIADLSQPQRQEIVQMMKDMGVYTVDYKGAKVVERDGKQGYEYSVRIDFQKYMAVAQRIDEMMGIGQLKDLDLQSYASAQPQDVTLVMSIDGRQLLEISYDDSTLKESFSSYGARLPVELPQTDTPRSELEEKIQRLFAPQS